MGSVPKSVELHEVPAVGRKLQANLRRIVDFDSIQASSVASVDEDTASPVRELKDPWILCWSWDPETRKLLPRPIHPQFHAAQQCEDTLLDLLSNDPRFPGAASLLVLLYASESIRAQSLLGAGRNRTPDLDRRANWTRRMNDARSRVSVNDICEALGRALSQSSTPMAEMVLSLIRTEYVERAR